MTDREGTPRTWTLSERESRSGGTLGTTGPKCVEHASRELRMDAAAKAGEAEWAEYIAREARGAEKRLLAKAEALGADTLEPARDA